MRHALRSFYRLFWLLVMCGLVMFAVVLLVTFLPSTAQAASPLANVPDPPPVGPSDPSPILAPAPSPHPSPAPVRVGYSWHTRAPRGHTHTCPDGHTFDHEANPGHACIAPVQKPDGTWRMCGLTQTTQDARPRPVHVFVATSPGAPVQVEQTTSRAETIYYESSSSYRQLSGCSSGQCAGFSGYSGLGSGRLRLFRIFR